MRRLLLGIGLLLANCTDRTIARDDTDASLPDVLDVTLDARLDVSDTGSSAECTTAFTTAFTGTWSNYPCHCPATYDEALASRTSVCPSGGGMQSAGACGDKLVLRAFLFPQGIYCVYDGTSRALVGGLSTTDTTSYCDHTSSCIQGGSLPAGVHCNVSSVTLPCSLTPLVSDGGVDASGADASDVASVE